MAFLDLIAVARHVVVVQHGIKQLTLVVLCQHIEQVTVADIACRQTVSVSLDVLNQVLKNSLIVGLVKIWPDAYIVRELSRIPSNFRSEATIQDMLKLYDIPGIAGIDTRALTKILREKGTMNGMITTNENINVDEIIPKLKEYSPRGVVAKVTCEEKKVLEGNGKKVALLDFGAKNNIARSLNERGCEVTIYPAFTSAEEIIESNPDGIMLSNGPGDPKECVSIIEELKKLYNTEIVSDISLWHLQQVQIHIR